MTIIHSPPPHPPPQPTLLDPAPPYPPPQPNPPSLDPDTLSLHHLATHGSLPLPLSNHPSLLSAYKTLFTRSATYFAHPPTSPQKTTYAAISGPAASEEGFSAIPREKQILTLKTTIHSPPELLSAAQEAWALTGELMLQTLRGIANTLHLEPNVFDPLVTPCTTLHDRRTPTLLRLFRYDRPPGPDPIVNAERHKDLGLLSLVVASSPGLHCLVEETGEWVPVEEDAFLPEGTRRRGGGLTATLLGGETLRCLTRGRYRAGVHGVVCAPPAGKGGEGRGGEGNGDGIVGLEGVEGEEAGEDRWRYSVVFTLRAADVGVWTKKFESQVVGEFGEGERMEGESAGVLFERIRMSCYNVNVKPEIRERQKKEHGEKREREMREREMREREMREREMREREVREKQEKTSGEKESQAKEKVIGEG